MIRFLLIAGSADGELSCQRPPDDGRRLHARPAADLDLRGSGGRGRAGRVPQRRQQPAADGRLDKDEGGEPGREGGWKREGGRGEEPRKEGGRDGMERRSVCFAVILSFRMTC